MDGNLRADQGGSNLAGIVHRNIGTILKLREDLKGQTTLSDRIAEAVGNFAGSMAFVYIHAALFVAWILINTRVLPILPAFDPFPFVMLAMIASVEAIFLSTFILITQNRMAATADRRAELDLQVSLLAEAEITKLVALVSEIAVRMEVPEAKHEDIEEMKRLVQPEAVLDAIENAKTEV